MTLTDFLLARIAEDGANNGCNGEGEYTTCWQRSERIERDCEARRRIVEFLTHHARYSLSGIGDQARGVLELLALPYADHPDYRDEWKP